MDVCMHCIYDYGEPRLILLTSCMKIAYDNYNLIEMYMKHSSTITLQLTYGLDMYNHVMCMCYHCPWNLALSTFL
jgi:hypothetical protein